MGLGFWLGLALLCVLAITLFLFIRREKRLTREEEQRAYEQRQTEARQADQERADEIAERADAAAAAIKKDAQRVGSDGDALAERLRDSGRGRKTKTGTDPVGKDRLR